MSSRAPVDWKDFEILGEQMKKIAKISLVAAVAVAGLTTANAQPLEEAIKNVDVSGSVVYRYNDYHNDATTNGVPNASTQTNNYKVGLNLSSKVNEDVKFNSRFLVASETGDFGSLKYDNGATNADNADINVGVTLSHANFAYTGLKNTTVTVGKQGLATPYTVAIQADGNEQTGTGALALSTVGPVTLGAAYFNQTNLNKSTDAVLNKTKLFDATTSASQLDGSGDIAAVAAIATFGPATVDAWYLNFDNTFDTYTVGAKVANKVAGIDLTADARYASLTFDKATATALRPAISATSAVEDSNSIAKLVLTADAGLIDGKLAYAKTGKDGGLTALDNDANTTLLGWSLTANGKADADYVQAVLGIDILSNLNLSANYGNLKYSELANSTTDVEEEEVYGQLLYTMSKNLTTYVRYGTYTKDTTPAGAATTKNYDDTRGRLQVKYTF